MTTNVDVIPILPCILVQTENGTGTADAVIVRLAKALAE